MYSLPPIICHYMYWDWQECWQIMRIGGFKWLISKWGKHKLVFNLSFGLCCCIGLSTFLVFHTLICLLFLKMI